MYYCSRRIVYVSWILVIHYLPLVPLLEIPGRVVAVEVATNECITIVEELFMSS